MKSLLEDESVNKFLELRARLSFSKAKHLYVSVGPLPSVYIELEV